MPQALHGRDASKMHATYDIVAEKCFVPIGLVDAVATATATAANDCTTPKFAISSSAKLPTCTSGKFKAQAPHDDAARKLHATHDSDVEMVTNFAIHSSSKPPTWCAAAPASTCRRAVEEKIIETRRHSVPYDTLHPNDFDYENEMDVEGSLSDLEDEINHYAAAVAYVGDNFRADDTAREECFEELFMTILDEGFPASLAATLSSFEQSAAASCGALS